jgi:nucleoside-diphosphate-sugar epimerase
MKILVTGSAGHLGEALMRTLASPEHRPIGLDIKSSPLTHLVGSIADREIVKRSMCKVDVVMHAATLHKPHIVTHSRQDFIDTNITGTLNLLEEAAVAGVRCFIFTSTTSTFGHALTPAVGAPAAWITEEVIPEPKNIYGMTKLAAESLCELFHRQTGMPCIILRTSRFFPEEDDNRRQRQAFEDANLKANEMLYRRADIADIVDAHRLAMERAASIGFRRYIISATSPFDPGDLADLHADAPAVVRRHVPGYEQEYQQRGWSMLPSIDRVYVNALARKELGWQPRYDFARVVELLRASEDFRSPLAITVGAKGYHSNVFAHGPYPV